MLLSEDVHRARALTISQGHPDPRHNPQHSLDSFAEQVVPRSLACEVVLDRLQLAVANELIVLDENFVDRNSCKLIRRCGLLTRKRKKGFERLALRAKEKSLREKEKSFERLPLRD